MGRRVYHTRQSRSKTWVGESVSYATPLLPLPRPSTSQIIPPMVAVTQNWLTCCRETEWLTCCRHTELDYMMQSHRMTYMLQGDRSDLLQSHRTDLHVAVTQNWLTCCNHTEWLTCCRETEWLTCCRETEWLTCCSHTEWITLKCAKNQGRRVRLQQHQNNTGQDFQHLACSQEVIGKRTELCVCVGVGGGGGGVERRIKVKVYKVRYLVLLSAGHYLQQ